jgi:predicted AlkP superfamily phosphohydrolase/phosphomutase
VTGSRRTLAALAASVALSVIAPTSASAWGFHGHRMVNRRAVGTLPEPLRRVFAANVEYVTEHAVDADLERLRSDDPNHFLDMDAFGEYPFPQISSVEAEHLARFGADAAAKGRVPWRVGEAYRALVDAFRARDVALVLKAAADLGHFVADAHVPLHAVLNHDGQMTGQRGLHNRWESALVERFARQLEDALQPGAAEDPGDPVALTFEVLRRSYVHHLEVLAADRESAGPRDLAETPEDDRYDDDYYSRLYAREAPRLRARLSASATTTGALWRRAWEEAGRPALPERRLPYVRRASRAILVSLDGGSARIFDDAVARGVMPHLARLRARGATATGAVTSLPVKTAVGHASLYTGAWSDRHGIGGNSAAIPGGPVTASADGYNSIGLRAEPLWFTAARQDLAATVLSATQAFPFSTYTDGRFPGYAGRRLTLFDGYNNRDAKDRVYRAKDLTLRPPSGWLGELPRSGTPPREFRLEVAGAAVDGLVYDDPADPVAGFDTVYLTLDRDATGGITLKPSAPREDAGAFAGLTLPLDGGDTAAYFRLFSLAPDASDLMLYSAHAHLLRSNKPRLEGAALEATGGFVGNSADQAYERGELGPPLWKGGDGTAERRYLETSALVVRQFSRLLDFGVDRTAWQVLFTYLPLPDEAVHVWYGRLDPTLPGHDPALAARLRPFLDRVLGLVDAHVGHLAAKAGPDVVLAVAADHGTAAISRVLKPNVALAAAGLLVLDAAGEPDLARTRAFYHPGTFILINGAARGGPVAPAEEDAVRRQVAAALRAVQDPATGRAAVLDVLDARTLREPSTGGPSGGDIYLSLAPGIGLSRGSTGAPLEEATPRGDHFANPERPSMHASFTVAGPGVAEGARLGLIRQTDVAPTLAALLGIDPPAQSTGRVLEAALAHRDFPYPPVRPALCGWPALPDSTATTTTETQRHREKK